MFLQLFACQMQNNNNMFETKVKKWANLSTLEPLRACKKACPSFETLRLDRALTLFTSSLGLVPALMSFSFMVKCQKGCSSMSFKKLFISLLRVTQICVPLRTSQSLFLSFGVWIKMTKRLKFCVFFSKFN